MTIVEAPTTLVDPLSSSVDRRTRRRRRSHPLLLAILVASAAAFLGLSISVVSGVVAGFEPLLLAAVIAGPVFFAVAIRRFDAAMLVAFSLFGIVNIEPAPVDALFAALVPLGILIGRMNLSKLDASRAIHLLVWAMGVLVLVSLARSDEPMHGFQYTLITIYCVTIMYLVKMYVASEQHMRTIVIGYLIGALGSVALVFGDLAGLMPSEVVIGQGRARGLFKDANVFGPYLVPALLILIDETWRPMFLRSWHVALRIAVAAMISIGVFLSFSRAAWGNMIAAFCLYFIMNLRALGPARRRKVWAALGLAAVGLAAFVVAFDLVSFLAYRANVLQSYDSQRFDAQRTGILLGLSNVIGIGPGMMDVNGLFAPHSLYIRSIAEVGIGGFSLMLALIATVCRSFRHLAFDNRRVYGLSGTVIVASILGQMLNGFLIDTLHWRHLWLLFGLAWLGHEHHASGRDAADVTHPAAEIMQ